MKNKDIIKFYNDCKTELLKTRRNIKYFNIDFVKSFLEYEQAQEKSDKDPQYIDVCKNVLEEKIFKSDFYNKNGGCYCEFLEVFAAI